MISRLIFGVQGMMIYLLRSCLAVELLTSYPCFNPRNESDLIKLIFDMCGSPDESSWPDVVNSEKYIQLKPEGTY